MKFYNVILFEEFFSPAEEVKAAEYVKKIKELTRSYQLKDSLFQQGKGPSPTPEEVNNILNIKYILSQLRNKVPLSNLKTVHPKVADKAKSFFSSTRRYSRSNDASWQKFREDLNNIWKKYYEEVNEINKRYRRQAKINAVKRLGIPLALFGAYIIYVYLQKKKKEKSKKR